MRYFFPRGDKTSTELKFLVALVEYFISVIKNLKVETFQLFAVTHLQPIF